MTVIVIQADLVLRKRSAKGSWIFRDADGNVLYSDSGDGVNANFRHRMATAVCDKIGDMGEVEAVEQMVLDKIESLRQEVSGNGVAAPRRGRGKYASDYILVPGPHVDAHEQYREVGNDEFARAVLARLPKGAIYRRGELPGEVVGDPGAKVFRPIAVNRLRLLIDQHAKLGKFVRRSKDGSEESLIVFLPCSYDHASLVWDYALIDPSVPELKTLTSYPVYTPGFILSRPGFHDGFYYDEPEELKDLEPETDTEVIREVLDDVHVDFPFKDAASRENAIGMEITPLIAPALSSGNRPAHLINSPMERTGKSKLAEEVLGGIILGRKTPAMQMPDDEQETDKRIVSALVEGGNLLHLDNLKPRLDSASLASLLTASTYRGRLLGQSKMLDLPNLMTIVATGNNVKATGELVKRMVPILLQPSTDAPEARTDFKHPDLWGYMRKNRRLILSCLIGMVKMWIEAGKPRGTQPMGGFEEWAATVGGVMKLMGYRHWLSNSTSWRDTADPHREDLRELVKAWHHQLGTRGNPRGDLGVFSGSATELLAIANNLELFPAILHGKGPERAVVTSFAMQVMVRAVDQPISFRRPRDGLPPDWDAEDPDNFEMVSVVIRRADKTRPVTYFLEEWNH